MLVLGRAVATTVRCVSMQVQTEPTKVLACNSKELRTAEAVGFGAVEDDLLVIVTALLLGVRAPTYV